MEGLVWELLRIKTVFYMSLLYKLEQDPALSTALSLRHTQVVFLWQHLLSTLVKIQVCHLIYRQRRFLIFLWRISYYLIEKLRHT